MGGERGRNSVGGEVKEVAREGGEEEARMDDC